MIPDVEGLVAADVVVLLFFNGHRWRMLAKPSTVAYNTPLSKSHANRRCNELAKAGLLERSECMPDLPPGYYRITNLGVRYILGEANASEIPDPRKSEE